MACPSSPEADGFHRFQLASHGVEFATRCVHCGAAKTLKPFEAEDTIPLYRRHKLRRPLSTPRVILPDF